MGKVPKLKLNGIGVDVKNGKTTDRCVRTAGVALAWMLCTSTMACIMNGPPVHRRHYITLADKNPWSTKTSAPVVHPRDLISVALPSGVIDDWKVSVAESRPGAVRVLTQEEFSAVRESRRALSIVMVTPGADRAAQIEMPSLYIGILRPGDATVRIEQIKGKARYQMNLRVEEDDHPIRTSAPSPRPADAGPVPTC